eukprot:Nk52_evm12s805 gene=Nk52_evmTU12s805
MARIVGSRGPNKAMLGSGNAQGNANVGEKKDTAQKEMSRKVLGSINSMSVDNEDGVVKTAYEEEEFTRSSGDDSGGENSESYCSVVLHESAEEEKSSVLDGRSPLADNKDPVSRTKAKSMESENEEENGHSQVLKEDYGYNTVEGLRLSAILSGIKSAHEADMSDSDEPGECEEQQKKIEKKAPRKAESNEKSQRKDPERRAQKEAEGSGTLRIGKMAFNSETLKWEEKKAVKSNELAKDIKHVESERKKAEEKKDKTLSSRKVPGESPQVESLKYSNHLQFRSPNESSIQTITSDKVKNLPQVVGSMVYDEVNERWYNANEEEEDILNISSADSSEGDERKKAQGPESKEQVEKEKLSSLGEQQPSTDKKRFKTLRKKAAEEWNSVFLKEALSSTLLDQSQEERLKVQEASSNSFQSKKKDVEENRSQEEFGKESEKIVLTQKEALGSDETSKKTIDALRPWERTGELAETWRSQRYPDEVIESVLDVTESSLNTSKLQGDHSFQSPAATLVQKNVVSEKAKATKAKQQWQNGENMKDLFSPLKIVEMFQAPTAVVSKIEDQSKPKPEEEKTEKVNDTMPQNYKLPLKKRVPLTYSNGLEKMPSSASCSGGSSPLSGNAKEEDENIVGNGNNLSTTLDTSKKKPECTGREVDNRFMNQLSHISPIVPRAGSPNRKWFSEGSLTKSRRRKLNLVLENEKMCDGENIESGGLKGKSENTGLGGKGSEEENEEVGALKQENVIGGGSMYSEIREHTQGEKSLKKVENTQRIVDLSGSKIDLTNPPVYVECRHLFMDKCHIECITSGFWACFQKRSTNLKSLSLEENDVALPHVVLPSPIDMGGVCASTISILNLTKNAIEDLDGVHWCTGLEELYLAGNKLKSTKLKDGSVLSLPKLKILDVSKNAISSMAVSGFPNLQRLYASWNDISCLQNIECLEALVHIDMSHNNISSVLLRKEYTFKKLEKANLSHNFLQSLADGDCCLSSFRMARKMNISRNQLRSLCGIELFYRIRTLNAHGNNIVDIDSIFWMSTIKIVNLSHNRITSLLPCLTLPALEELDVSNNLISSIHTKSRYLSLKKVYPGKSFGCPDLRKLNLSFNKLVDVEFFNLPEICFQQVQSLNLSFNNLFDQSSVLLGISHSLRFIRSIEFEGNTGLFRQEPVYEAKNKMCGQATSSKSAAHAFRSHELPNLAFRMKLIVLFRDTIEAINGNEVTEEELRNAKGIKLRLPKPKSADPMPLAIELKTKEISQRKVKSQDAFQEYFKKKRQSYDGKDGNGLITGTDATDERGVMGGRVTRSRECSLLKSQEYFTPSKHNCAPLTSTTQVIRRSLPVLSNCETISDDSVFGSDRTPTKKQVISQSPILLGKACYEKDYERPNLLVHKSHTLEEQGNPNIRKRRKRWYESKFCPGLPRVGSPQGN